VNVDEMQKTLSLQAALEPEPQFENLSSRLCNQVGRRTAHHTVNTNQGRETAGRDGEEMMHCNGNSEGNLDTLRAQLKAKVFEPMPVRRVYMPKANGKQRPLGIPTIRDRLVQEALRMLLAPIWEADLSHRSYGFRPNRSTDDAISYLSNRLARNGGGKFQWVIEGDITSYFDTIPPRRLIKASKKRVADRDVRDVLWTFLRAGVMEQGEQHDTLTGTPQGGILSPLLANIYLHELDMDMESKYLNLSKVEREKRRRHKEANCWYVRYADDFVVLSNGTKAQVLAMKEELKGVLDHMGLKLSEEKTKVTHITEGFKFLGYWIIRAIGETGNMVPKVYIPESAMQRAIHESRRLRGPQTTNDAIAAKLIALNRFIGGWCQYYRCTSSPVKECTKLEMELFWDMPHWLGKKYKSHTPAILRRFKKGAYFSNDAGTVKLVKPDSYKAKKRLVKTWHNPYTGSDKIAREIHFSYDTIWSGYQGKDNHWYDNREEVMRLKGTICAIQGPECISQGKPLHPSEVEIDHIIPRWQLKDPKEVNRMDNLQPVCTPCHRAKTKTDRKVLSRMPGKGQVRF
jgi:group II intron reverse transcriptase/maturase